MDFKDLIRLGYDEYLDDLKDHLSGLSPEERRFQPTPESNHIDFIVWHMARVEDDFVQRFAQQRTRFGSATTGTARWVCLRRRAASATPPNRWTEFPAFDMDELLAYYDAVRVETYKFLDSISESDLALRPHPRRPEYSLANMFSHLLVEESQHVGHVAYLRGIQRGIEE